MKILLILMPICLILQEIQIILLRRDLDAVEELMVKTLSEKLKVTLMEFNDDKDEDDE